MKRITQKYILLTVLYREKIQRDLIQYVSCWYIGNPSYYQRNLSLNRIKNPFTDYRIVGHSQLGSGKSGYNSFSLKIKHAFVPSSGWIPIGWTKHQPINTMCPQCETVITYTYRFHLLDFLCNILNVLFISHKS